MDNMRYTRIIIYLTLRFETSLEPFYKQQWYFSTTKDTIWRIYGLCAFLLAEQNEVPHCSLRNRPKVDAVLWLFVFRLLGQHWSIHHRMPWLVLKHSNNCLGADEASLKMQLNKSHKSAANDNKHKYNKTVNNVVGFMIEFCYCLAMQQGRTCFFCHKIILLVRLS